VKTELVVACFALSVGGCLKDFVPLHPRLSTVDGGAELPPSLGGMGGDGGAAADLAQPSQPDLASGPDLAPRPQVAIRINVNGAAYQGVDYPGMWAADPGVGGVCNGQTASTMATINGTKDGALFNSEMYAAQLDCKVGNGTLPSGNYAVNLYFAEIYWGPGCPGAGTGTGSRVFDIILNGTTVQKSFDIFAEGGCAASTTDTTTKPVVKKYTMAITGGTLDISMPASANDAKISAIEVLSVP
jgi:hypothetical protein